MCGIVGLFLKDRNLEPRLGDMLTDMLITMSDRGPDSAGIAIYGAETQGRAKLTVQSNTPDVDFAGLDAELGTEVVTKDTHAVLHVDANQIDSTRARLSEIRPNVRVMGRGLSLIHI